MKNILIFLIALICLTAVSQNVNKQQNNKLSIIEKFSNKNYHAGVVVLWEGEVFSTGFSNQETQTKSNTNDLFEIGSASKVFTAIAILQLIEEGKLTLNTTLKSLYPNGEICTLANYKESNYCDKVTVEMLLNHTSGFVDYLNVYESDEKALEIFNHSKKHYSLHDIVKLATDFGDANFIPGSKFKYSNTGYILLGDIITKITKTPWKKYIEENIFKKARLQNTHFGSTIPSTSKNKMMKGYFKTQATQIPYSLADSAGEIISNLKDLELFLKYWQSGGFFKNPATFTQQITTGVNSMTPGSDMLTYGLGAMLLNDTAGHGGQTFGFQSYIAINPKTQKTYIIGINNANASVLNLLMMLFKSH